MIYTKVKIYLINTLTYFKMEKIRTPFEKEEKFDITQYALVCTASMDGVCILYEFKPVDEAIMIAKKTMGER